MSETRTKKRNWAFVLYPESAPADWLEQIQLSGLMAAISPLHDQDLNADKTPKKPHYHVILVYNNTTTFNNVKQFTSSLNQPIPISLEHVRGYYRYFTHKDNPEKHQYNESEIKELNGFAISDFVELTDFEITEIKVKIQKFIRDNDVFEYAELMDLLLDEELNSMYDIASKHTLFFNTYIRSRRHSLEFDRLKDMVEELKEEENQKHEEHEEHEKEHAIACPFCGSVDIIKRGKTLANTQRFKCKDCGKVFTKGGATTTPPQGVTCDV